jgi:hypothetical protein
MEYNKNSPANGFLFAVVFGALFLMGLLIFGSAGVHVTAKNLVFTGGSAGNLSYEDQEMVDTERQTL